jgi:hypothetical protein
VVDQSVKDMLRPGRLRQHMEFRIPSATPGDIREISLPRPSLRPLKEVPLFGWARSEEAGCWLSLVSARQSGDIGQIPKAPDLDSDAWAISGTADLGDALSWAVSSTQGSARDRWLFQHGAWLAARGETNTALEVPGRSRDDRAQALSERLWRVHRRDAHSAAKCFRAIESEAVALHPHVVIERDLTLAALGRETLDERGRWLKVVSALDDEWLAERRACWLIDSGDLQAAFQVPKTTKFQLVHQRYEQTCLWGRLETDLGLEPLEDLSWLGEDDLAEFGAYRDDPAV